MIRSKFNHARGFGSATTLTVADARAIRRENPVVAQVVSSSASRGRCSTTIEIG